MDMSLTLTITDFDTYNVKSPLHEKPAKVKGGQQVQIVSNKDSNQSELKGIKTYHLKEGQSPFMAGSEDSAEIARNKLQKKGLVAVRLGEQDQAVAVKISDLAKQG